MSSTSRMTPVTISPTLEMAKPTSAAPARPPMPPPKRYSQGVKISTRERIQERRKVKVSRPKNHLPMRRREPLQISLTVQPMRKMTMQKAARPKLCVTSRWPMESPPEAAALRMSSPEARALWSGLQLKTYEMTETDTSTVITNTMAIPTKRRPACLRSLCRFHHFLKGFITSCLFYP